MTTTPLSGKNRDTENFPVGSFLIRADLRKHVHALYNYARAADDISDDPLMDATSKVALLSKFEYTLTNSGNEEIESAATLRRSLEATGVTARHALDLLAAFKRDATQLRYKNWDDLIDYCNYSASPVGRHVLALHGVGQEAWTSSDALCNALQIINHLQDCADDYRQLDRVYIPNDMLDKFGSSARDLSQERSTPGLRATMNAMVDLVEPLLAKAKTLPRAVPDIRLKCETSIIGVLAEKLTVVLRTRDPLCDNVKLGRGPVLGATLVGIIRAFA